MVDLYTSVKNNIDEFIKNNITDRVEMASLLHPTYANLWRHIGDVASDGKRIRPYLTVVTYGVLDETIIPVAAAQEYVHIAVLMHDDVIDQDLKRHGKANINGIYDELYSKYHGLDSPKALHYAYGNGILAGDLLISEAYRSINVSNFSAEKKQLVHDELSRSIFEVVGGELMDVESGFPGGEHYDPIETYKHKTASYSFIRPLVTGAICGDWPAKDIEILKTFGEKVGIAFQAQDDLLGVYGDEKKTGKSTLTDLKEGKNTALVTAHRSLANKDQLERLQCLGSPKASNEQFEALKQDMKNSVARSKTETLVEKYFSEARESLKDLPKSPARATLNELIDRLSVRRA